jgi:hypothetical protein
MNNDVAATLVFAALNLAAIVFVMIGTLIASILIDVIYSHYGSNRINWRRIVLYEFVSFGFFLVGCELVFLIGKALRAPGIVSAAIFFGIMAATGLVYIGLTKKARNVQTVIFDTDGNGQSPATDNFQ